MSATQTLCRCGSGLPLDDDGMCIVCWFDQFRPAAPRIHWKDAVRVAAHGYSAADELREVGPEPSDLWEAE